MTKQETTDRLETLPMSISAIEQPRGQLLQFPIKEVSVATQATTLPEGVTSPDNIVDFPVRESDPLWKIVDRRYRKQTETFEGRIRQRYDMSTIDRMIAQEKPTYMSIQTLWQELGGRGSFQQPTWSEHSTYFGAPDMYTDPKHPDTIHGEMHQDKGRVLALVEILGQYKHLSKSDMKILHVVASHHDMARTSDMEDPNHGLRAAMNVTEGKNYLGIYEERGLSFTPEEINLIKILDIYHEKSWDIVPLQYKENKRIATLIQTIQAADGLDRFRSPDPDWRPQARYFMRFFDNDTRKIDAAFAFAKHLAIMSEKRKLENNLSAEQTMYDMLNHIGFLKDETPPTQPFGWSTLRRKIPYSGL